MRTRKLIVQVNKALRKTTLAALQSPEITRDETGSTCRTYYLHPHAVGYAEAVRFFRDRLDGKVARALDLAPALQRRVTVILHEDRTLRVELSMQRGKSVAKYVYEVQPEQVA